MQLLRGRRPTRSEGGHPRVPREVIHALRGRRSTRHTTLRAPASDRHGDARRVLPASPMFTVRSPGGWVAVVRLTCPEMLLLGSVTEWDAHVGTAFAPPRASRCMCRRSACGSVRVRSRLLGRGALSVDCVGNCGVPSTQAVSWPDSTGRPRSE